MSNWTDHLCPEAVEWARTQPSPVAAWRNCQRGDWMLLLLERLSGPPESTSRRKLVLAARACERLALPHVQRGELRPLTAIEVAETLARCADIVREHYPRPPRLAQRVKRRADSRRRRP